MEHSENKTNKTSKCEANHTFARLLHEHGLDRFLVGINLCKWCKFSGSCLIEGGMNNDS